MSKGKVLFTAGGNYSKFRPTYPPQLFSSIFSFAEQWNKEKSLAVDIGCGTGQVTSVLANSFEKVIGVDPSASQIGAAKRISNVEFYQGQGENLEMINEKSVDLITIAQTVCIL